MRISDAVVFPDIAKLPKNDLQDLCISLNLDSNDSAFDLARKFWNEIKDRRAEEKARVLHDYSNKLFAGNTSISWYFCDTLEELKQNIISNSNVNPFTEKIPYNADDLSPHPILRSAIEISESSYYLRFVYQDGTRRIYNEDIEVLRTTKTATVYVNEAQNLIEVREKPHDAEKIAQLIASYAEQTITLEKYDFLSPYGSEIHQIADRLENGRLNESKAFPHLAIDTFTEYENEAIINILGAIDNYYEEENIDNLQERLEESKATLGEELLTSPFIAIILAGMENVGLKVTESDLRETPFYNLLSPYLQASGGYIKFNVEVNGIQNEFSMVIGVKPKSIYFNSKKTTEEVITEVRDHIILN